MTDTATIPVLEPEVEKKGLPKKYITEELGVIANRRSAEKRPYGHYQGVATQVWLRDKEFITEADISSFYCTMRGPKEAIQLMLTEDLSGEELYRELEKRKI